MNDEQQKLYTMKSDIEKCCEELIYNPKKEVQNVGFQILNAARIVYANALYQPENYPRLCSRKNAAVILRALLNILNANQELSTKWLSIFFLLEFFGLNPKKLLDC